MSVQIIENWSDVEGVVDSFPGSSGLRGFVAVQLTVSKVKAVEGFANLLKDIEGKSLVVLIPEELAASQHITKGLMIGCRVRCASPGKMFVHQDYLSVRPTE